MGLKVEHQTLLARSLNGDGISDKSTSKSPWRMSTLPLSSKGEDGKENFAEEGGLGSTVS